MEGAEDAFNDVCNKGIIAARRAVSEDGDRLARFDQSDEFIDGEVGALAGAIDGKEAQPQKADPVEVAVDMAHQLATDLGAGVGADGLEDMVVLAPGNAGVDPIDGRGGGEDELLDPLLFGEFQ